MLGAWLSRETHAMQPETKYPARVKALEACDCLSSPLGGCGGLDDLVDIP